uniref:Uncharacterized protein n=1 Tax=Globodera rostochiensis TaxID=31243 RepID=A0A914HD18_GLORO
MALTGTSDTNATKTTICANDKSAAAEAATNNGTNLCNNNSTRVGAFRHKIVCRVCCWSPPTTVLMFLAFCCVLLSSFGAISNAELIPSNVFNTENANTDNNAHQQPQPQHQSKHAALKRATKMHQKQRQQQTEEAQQQFTDEQRMPPLVLLKLLDDVEAESGNNNNNFLPLIDYKLAMDNSRSSSSTEENILSSSSSTDDRTEQFQDQSVVMLPLLPPKRKKSVRRCGTLLLKHIQTVCGGCLRSPNPSETDEAIIMGKRDGESQLDMRRRMKKQSLGFSKITDICCTQRACDDEEVKPFCC